MCCSKRLMGLIAKGIDFHMWVFFLKKGMFQQKLKSAIIFALPVCFYASIERGRRYLLLQEHAKKCLFFLATFPTSYMEIQNSNCSYNARFCLGHLKEVGSAEDQTFTLLL